MAITSIDLDQALLEQAKRFVAVGVTSNRKIVDQALRTFIAVHTQPAAVERIIARQFTDEQISAGVVHYDAPGATAVLTASGDEA